MICKIIWGWVQNGFISLPVVWLAGFPTNYGFMRAFKEHVCNSGAKKPQQIGKIKAGFLVMVLPQSQSLSKERRRGGNFARRGMGLSISVRGTDLQAKLHSPLTSSPDPFDKSGNSFQLCSWLQLTSCALHGSLIPSKHSKPDRVIQVLFLLPSPALLQAVGWGKMTSNVLEVGFSLSSKKQCYPFVKGIY